MRAGETIDQLQTWFAETCDGDWEHGWGVRIATIDNPGWSLEVHLADTPLEGRKFQTVNVERSETDWCTCRLEENAFRGWGGAMNLAEMLNIFITWANQPETAD